MSTSMPMSVPPKTKKITGKSFKLYDFKTYDGSLVAETSGSSSESSSSSDADSDSGKKRGSPPDRVFMIQCFGLNEKGETCSIFIRDFKPFFFAKVADHWTQEMANTFMYELKSNSAVGPYYKTLIESVVLVEHNKLYGFSGNKTYKFVKLVFKNMSCMNKVKGLWYSYNPDTNQRRCVPLISQNTKLDIYEGNIPPLLRYFHINNISPSGWVFINLANARNPTNKVSTCKYEFICDVSDLISQPNKETIVPYKICSFDIEASSSHGDFPVPKKSYKRLSTQLVDIYLKQFSVDTKITQARSETMLTKIINTAFGYGNFDGIDLVYPKIIPTKPELSRSITTFLSDHYSELENITNDVLTLESMFERLNESANADVIDEMAENDADADADTDANGDLDVNVNVNTGSETSGLKYKQRQRQAGNFRDKPDGMTIVQLLNSVKYTRNEKIDFINGIMTPSSHRETVFPELEGDKVTFIGSTFLVNGEREPYLNHCLVLNTCDNIDNATIVSVDTERELLLKWKELILAEKPNIIIGYNIFGFDYEFMFRRSQETYCEREFLVLSMNTDELCASEDRNTMALSLGNTKISLASGEYDLRYPVISGILQIDLYTYFRKDYNLSSYKLDDVAGNFISDDITKIHVDKDSETTHLYTKNIAGLRIGDYIHIEITSFTSDYYKDGEKFIVKNIIKSDLSETCEPYNIIVIAGEEFVETTNRIKWCMAKDDVSPKDIFRLANGNSADRAKVAKYCIQDCNLVHHLMNKVDVMTGYVEMARICSVPISYLVFRGQGIKLTSFVAKKCREKNTLMPDLEKSFDNEGYEGAIVLPPKCSLYMDKPVACVDYSSLYPSNMISQNYSHDSKVWTKEYNLAGELVKETGERTTKGEYIYDNLPGYQYIDTEFDLFRWERKSEKAKREKVKIGVKLCRWAQLPDNKRSILPAILEELLKARAATRKQIKTTVDPFMKNILDKRQLGYKVTANSLYGQCGSRTSTFYEKDIAASTTATGRTMIIYAKRIIEEVYKNRGYDTICHGPVLTNAEYVYGDSVASYTPVYIKYTNPNNSENTIEALTIDQVGVKYGKNRWFTVINKHNADGVKTEKEYCFLDNIWSWSEKGWTPIKTIMRHKLSSHKKMFRITTHSGIVDVTSDHSLLTDRCKVITPNNCKLGTSLLHEDLPDMKKSAFKCLFETPISIRRVYKVKSQLDAAVIVWFLNSWGYAHTMEYIQADPKKILCENRSFNEEPIKLCSPESIYIIRVLFYYEETNDKKLYSDDIINIEELCEYNDYVYDFTTENHHFSAGIGTLVVHNTDSVFFTFNLQDPQTNENIVGKKALEITIEIAQDAAELCSKFLKPPMELSYEKTLMPFILLSKKRYVGMLYETDPTKGSLKYMGLSLKRRDSCDYLKDIYGGILNILIHDNNIQKAIQFLDTCLEALIRGDVHMDKLAITKALRSFYKNPAQIAHSVLAERIGMRDPGNKPKSGDRIKFVYIVNKNTKALQGNRIETPEFITQNNLKIDYTHYITNQIMKPIQQLLGLALEQIWEYQNKHSTIRKYKQELAEINRGSDDLEMFMKRKEKYCSDKIKTLLFEKYLIQISNKQNNMSQISSFFKPI
jgi:DNA polymerase elongation subunit (family B)